MNKKSNAAAVVAYLTWIGFIIALIIRDRSDRFTTLHLNQALVINILSMIGGALAIFPLVGELVSTLVAFAVMILWCIGIFRAVTWNDTPLPIVGEIRLFN